MLPIAMTDIILKLALVEDSRSKLYFSLSISQTKSPASLIS